MIHFLKQQLLKPALMLAALTSILDTTAMAQGVSGSRPPFITGPQGMQNPLPRPPFITGPQGMQNPPAPPPRPPFITGPQGMQNPPTPPASPYYGESGPSGISNENHVVTPLGNAPKPAVIRYQIPSQYAGTPGGYLINYGGARYLTNHDGTMSPY